MIFSKSQNFSQPFTTGSMLSKISAIGLAACLLVTGCTKADQNATPVEGASEEPSSKQALSENDAIASHAADSRIDSNVQKKPEGKPVSYDVQNWQAAPNQDLSLEDVDTLKRQFGKVTVTDSKSLDYASNIAVKYRFMAGDQPYLDIIDSQDYVELGWYYANPNDSDKEKNMSINHAQKVYQVMTGLMGDEGSELVQDILSGKIIKNKEINGTKVELAKCEFYSCMIVMNKQG